MRVLLQHAIEAAFDKYEDLKGAKVYVRETSGDDLSSYLIRTDAGFSFRILCQESTIRCLYNRWFSRDRKRVVYTVYCECDESAPKTLKEHLGKVMVFPLLTNRYTGRERKRKEAINAYLDLVFSA